MDIALLSMAMSQANVQQQVSVAVMKQAMGTAEQQGKAIQNLMETTSSAPSPHPQLGRNFDIQV
ncbi:YjfB family protein [Alkalicoccobacillus porphyridii]|uniref:Putative motility protein n=1 Tax=Alkalicoccobacillus porphyridii TaxID=2597270 RepID=A0A554A414_9BACI|nr:YjfB family protein [Alkalicoccobacillus porphyridii]TSB48440.1 putative motility protein [Alkalicoccobacillus porphyridii]